MNNDVNDDFDQGPDTDLDTDFGEFDQDGGKGSFSDLVKRNPAVKIGLIVAGLLVIIGAITLFGGTSAKPPASTVAEGSDVKEIPGTKELSPEMKEVMDEHNQQMIDQAVKTGTSVIPQPIEPPKEHLPFPTDETQTEDPLLRWRQMQEERLKSQQTEQANASKQKADPAEAQAAAAMVTSLSTQMNQILSGKKIDPLKSMQVTNVQELLAKQAAQQAAKQQTTLAAQQQAGIDPKTGLPVVPPKILLPAGAIEYSQLLIEANSDVNGPIVALIVSGPFAGSRVLGTFTAQEEFLVMHFTTLVNKKGISIPVDAYALDPDTTLTGLATDVDHRYWQRIVLPAAAEFVSGLGEAYADKEGNQTVVTGDVVVQTDPPLDVKQQVAKGVQKAAERVSDVLDKEGDKTQPQIRVRAGTPMGILFMSPITDQDQIAGLNNPETARTLQAQQQQQSLLQQQLQGSQMQNPMYLIQGLQNQQNLQAQQMPNTGTVGTLSTYGTNGNTSGTTNKNIFSTQQYLNSR